MDDQPQAKNAAVYAERASNSIFGMIFGIIFLIAATIVLISNEVTNIMRDNFWLEWRNWLLRGSGFLLFYLGLRLSFYIIGVVLSIFPYLKPAFAFINNQVSFLMSVITTLIVISIPWLFHEPLVTLELLIPVAIIWVYMRKIKARHQARLKEEFENSGDNKLSEVDRIIDTTYTDVAASVNKNKERVKSVVDKFK